jgi:hypothetical protein
MISTASFSEQLSLETGVANQGKYDLIFLNFISFSLI